MPRITEYPKTAQILPDDVLLKDGRTGTSSIPVSDLLIMAAEASKSVDLRRQIYRGKKLGYRITEAQQAAIKSGSFDDLFVGDYWIASDDVTYRIVDFDYWRNVGTNGKSNYMNHHIVLMPDIPLFQYQMNEDATTIGGYYQSNLYNQRLAVVRKQIIGYAFGSLVAKHQELLVTEVDADGIGTKQEWIDADITIPNEIMIYGSYISSMDDTAKANHLNKNNSVSFRQTGDKTQLALFKIRPDYIYSRQSMYGYWLRDVASDTKFSMVSREGAATTVDANANAWIRPVFAVGITD